MLGFPNVGLYIFSVFRLINLKALSDSYISLCVYHSTVVNKIEPRGGPSQKLVLGWPKSSFKGFPYDLTEKPERTFWPTNSFRPWIKGNL